MRQALAAVALLLTGCAGLSPRHPAPLDRRWPVMGTYAEATVWGDPAPAAAAMDRLRESLDAADLALSNWKPDSALSRFNEAARAGEARATDRLLADCVDAALDAAQATDGAFDPTVGPLLVLWGLRPGPRRTPAEGEIEAALRHVGWRKVLRLGPGAVRFEDGGMEIDLGGIGKGCALDAAMAAVARSGSRAGILDLGRSFAVWGRPPEGTWKLGLAAPGGPGDELLGTVALAAPSFVSTSSQEENPGHLVDPRTGRAAATDVLSATAIASTGTVSDLLSTALFVAGSERAAAILEAYPGARAVLVVREAGELTLFASAGLEGRFTVDPAWRARLAAVSFTLP